MEVNTSKFAARHLGISEQAFEDALTKEINDLLEEIEKTRLEALNDPPQEHHVVGPTPQEKVKLHKTPHSSSEATQTVHTDQPVRPDISHTQRLSHKGSTSNDPQYTSPGLIGRRKKKEMLLWS